MDAWYADRPEVKAWLKNVKAIALEKGWTQTLLGRYRNLTRHLQPIIEQRTRERKFPNTMGHGLRAAINTPI
jgi:DNA polymerase-1